MASIINKNKYDILSRIPDNMRYVIVLSLVVGLAGEYDSLVDTAYKL